MHGSKIAGSHAATLNRRAPFALGATLVSPASREVHGPGGRAMIEPRVMQVLVVLADAGGAVVTRAALLEECWDGQFVGEDALNRAVGEVRRVARTVAAGGFSIETIPRTGYRLSAGAAVPGEEAAVVAAGSPVADGPFVGGAVPDVRSTRRGAMLGLAGAAAGCAAAAGAAAWWWPDADRRRAAELVAAGDLALQQDMPDPALQGVGFYRAATALASDDPATWGRLAQGLGAAAEYAGPREKAAMVASCEAAARRALALDPAQGDALAALALLQPEFGDWLAAENRLRRVLAVDPDNISARAGLAATLQSVGRSRDSAAIGLSLSAGQPLSPKLVYRRSYALWNLGDTYAADRNIDRAIELWPRHPAVWFTRLWLLALTGRAPAAVAMVDDTAARPAMVDAAHTDLLRVSMIALATRAAADVDAALRANRAAVMAGPSWSIYAIMILSRLGLLDAAFAVADGYLLRKGALVGPLRHSAAQPSVNDQRHRKTMMLFIPPTRVLREDARFLPLCEAMGLADYWRASGKGPDFLGGVSPPRVT